VSLDLEIEIPTHRGRLQRGRALAFDRRTYDRDGRLTVTDCVISAAQVNPYVGREITDADKLGLDPDRMYALYRDPAALKAAVPLFNGVPLLIDHVAVTAESPKQQFVVGTARDCEWLDGKVVGTLNVWDADAIRGIELDLQRDLSAGYHYRPEVQAGTTPDGERFDVRMVDIVPNHVALVAQGRVQGAMVGDSGSVHAQGAALARLIPHYNRLK